MYHSRTLSQKISDPNERGGRGPLAPPPPPPLNPPLDMTAKLSNLSSLSWKQSSHFLKIHFFKVLRIYVLVMLSPPQCVDCCFFSLLVTFWPPGPLNSSTDLSRRIVVKMFQFILPSAAYFLGKLNKRYTPTHFFIGKRFRNIKNSVLIMWELK